MVLEAYWSLMFGTTFAGAAWRRAVNATVSVVRKVARVGVGRYVDDFYVVDPVGVECSGGGLGHDGIRTAARSQEVQGL